MTAPARPVLRYHGGKWMLAPWVIQHLPPHRIYTEPYGGAASVLMRKPRARLIDVYNDADNEIVSLFRLLRDPATAGALRQVLRDTPYARDEFMLSYEPADDPIEQARRTVTRAFMGFGSDSASGATTGFRANGNRQNTHPANDFANYPDAVEAFTQRLRGVVIENRPALEIIRQHDSPETLHYCDPPYVHADEARQMFEHVLCGMTAPVKDRQQQQVLMRFDPAYGTQVPYPSHAQQWRDYHGKVAWLFNPWTGARRDAQDIGSDTFGLLIIPPGEPVVAG